MMTDGCNNPIPETLEETLEPLLNHQTQQSDASEPPNAANPERCGNTAAHKSKADSNRDNAQKSTGPKTEAGKANSGRNALKHGILASQAVIATIEGREGRKMFDDTVAGLMEDYQPVGELEELLVQQIAACFWRYRRMLRFENRAAFAVRDRRAFAKINEGLASAVQSDTLYDMGRGGLEDGEAVCAKAGLDAIDLPSEADTIRITRYENAITRTMYRAMAKLEASRKARVAKAKSNEPPPAPADLSREPVVDVAAEKRDRAAVAKILPTGESLQHGNLRREMWLNRSRAADAAAAAASEHAQNDQTKPNLPPYPKEMADSVTLLKAMGIVKRAESVLVPKVAPET